MTLGRYLLGVASLAIVIGSCAYAAYTVRARFLSEWTGAQARLAEVVTGLAVLIGVCEFVGAVGLFRLGWVVGGCALAALVVARAAGRCDGERVRAAHVSAVAPPGRSTGLIAAAACALAASAVIAEWAAPTIQSYNVGILSLDSLWYHLPWAASFAQTGHITPLRFTDVEYLTAFYPATSELLHGLGIVLLGRDTLSPGLNLVWLPLVVLAGYCIGRPRGLGALTAVGAALAMAIPTLVSTQAGTAANDVVGVFFLLAAVALLLSSEWSEAAVVLAALAAGFAAGVKLSLLAPVVALTVGTIAVAPSERRGRIAGLWLGPLVLAGGFWYVRNLIAVGNPLPWSGLGGLLATPAAPLQQHTAFTLAHYFFNGSAWRRVFEPGLRSGLGPWWPVILVLAIAGPLLCVLPRRLGGSVPGGRGLPGAGRGSPGAGRDRLVQMLGVVALVSLVAYVLTPETAAGPRGDPVGFTFNLRYAAPALALSLSLLPLAPVFQRGRGRELVLPGLLATLVATLAQGALWPERKLAGAVGVGLVALLALALVGRRPLRGRAPLGAVALTALAVAIAGYPWQQHYLRGRYVFHPHVSDLARVWARFRGVHDARVGIVGTYVGFFSYPLDGLDDSNRVQYVASRGPHGSFQPIRTCRGWRAAVEAGHYRYLVTTPSRNPWNPSHLGFSPEGAWTASSPNARVVYRRVANGEPVTVFELVGPLGVGGCGAVG